jgi:hypothetical protein
MGQLMPRTNHMHDSGNALFPPRKSGSTVIAESPLRGLEFEVPIPHGFMIDPRAVCACTESGGCDSNVWHW